MKDPHLNIFYSYNRDNELIENNMTRAFIVLLKYLSDSNKNQLLNILFHEPIQNKSIGLALQGNIDSSIIHKSKAKKIIALTDYNCVEGLDDYHDSREYQKIDVSDLNRPDAWIFDSEQYEFCFLIEVKPLMTELKAAQYISYAKQYYGYHKISDLKKNLIRITWYDILQVLPILKTNEQELILISDFEEYLTFCGIKLFNGFNWESLKSACHFKLNISSANLLPSWGKLYDPPQFNL